MNLWALPQDASIDGRTYRINADFRDVLDIISRLNDLEQDEQTRVYVALALFYDDFEQMPESDYREATQWMLEFVSCGELDDGRPRHKTIDWEQDQSMIVSDVSKVAGCDIRALPFCHWWTFVAWFNGIGEGQLSTVVAIREKLRKGKKLSDWERDFYRENRSRVDFKMKYTPEEKALLDKFLGK